MKNLSLFFVFFVPFFCFGQVNESFLDGNFINNPIWTGTTSNFTVNNAHQLQSQAASTSTSFLFTPSEAIDNAVWECWVKINYTTSSSNYAVVYLVSDQADITSGCNGYYVQIGGTNDEVSLFVQEGAKKTKIIDGADKRTDGNPIELRIKVTRDANGNFVLYSKLASEADFVTEGTVQNKAVKASAYFGILFSNTTTTGSAYYFDDILVTGEKAIDKSAPEWTSFTLEQPNKLKLGFSEPMDFSKSAFSVDKEIGNPSSQNVSADKLSVILTFNSAFEHGKIYNLQVSGLSDLAGNQLSDTTRSIGIVEPKVVGDLIINEIMFENPLNSLEYIEIYNRSDKVLDVSGMVLTTRKTDGSLNTGIKIPVQTCLLPNGYIALCEDADSVRNYHNCPVESNILSTEWTSLNNETASVVLTNATKDTVYDEVRYDAKWHHALVKNPKGVALERINPDLPSQDGASWHSAASEVNYGTPGYKNSQYRDITSDEKAA
ncbi:MAG TPA: lamin tail domain-containing protein, partial [Paludibacter sp.]